MSYYTQSFERVVHSFSKFPGIGFKTAEKLAFYILKASEDEIHLLSESILELKMKIQFCELCFNLTESRQCQICQDEHRDSSIICVVEDFKDVISIEKTGEYKGLYHVLMGHLSPIDGVGADELKIKELMNRIGSNTQEIILACNPNIEGDTTSLYIAQLLHKKGLKATRIARGVPLGTDLEYADSLTLSRAILKREVIH